MNVFEKNILSIYGEKGRLWLANLPKKIQYIETLWELSDLKPYNNISYNYVLSGYQKETPIVLKLSLDPINLDREAKALQAFSGHGAVSVLKHQSDALLLQRAVPGNLLKTYFPKENHNAIEIACEVMKKLHQAPLLNEKSFPHIKDWLATLDKDWDIPKNHLHKARTLKNQLLKTPASPVLLHGDLHRDNILSHKKEWLVIDPKGVIGYPINEVWAFVEDPLYDLQFISNYFDFKFEDVVKWYYVHLVLAACWQVEDSLDPKLFLDLASSVESTMSILKNYNP